MANARRHVCVGLSKLRRNRYRNKRNSPFCGFRRTRHNLNVLRASEHSRVKRNVSAGGNGHTVLRAFVVDVVVRRAVDRCLEGEGSASQCRWRDKRNQIAQTV